VALRNLSAAQEPSGSLTEGQAFSMPLKIPDPTG